VPVAGQEPVSVRVEHASRRRSQRWPGVQRRPDDPERPSPSRPALRGAMLRLAVVGVGVRGRKWARVVAESPSATAVAYVDRDLEGLQQWIRDVGHTAVPCFEHLDRALAATRPDALVIATPPAAHYGHVMAGLERGIPVLVEKPLSDE